MIGCFKSLREAIRTGAANFVESQSELMKASEKPSCTVRTQRSDQDSSRPLLARGKTAISRFYRASVPVGPRGAYFSGGLPKGWPDVGTHRAGRRHPAGGHRGRDGGRRRALHRPPVVCARHRAQLRPRRWRPTRRGDDSTGPFGRRTSEMGRNETLPHHPAGGYACRRIWSGGQRRSCA